MNRSKRKLKKSHIFIINLILIAIWHIASFIACITIKGDIFNNRKKQYQPYKWERNGRWYKEKLKINRWKDILPQYIGKDGFSKQKFNAENANVEYVNSFIYETCRGEWNHSINLIYAPIALIINFILESPGFGVLFSLCTIIANLPFLIIQRYNRFRLLTVRKKLLRDKRRKERKSKTHSKGDINA